MPCGLWVHNRQNGQVVGVVLQLIRVGQTPFRSDNCLNRFSSFAGFLENKFFFVGRTTSDQIDQEGLEKSDQNYQCQNDSDIPGISQSL